jgi:hypothetical protein
MAETREYELIEGQRPDVQKQLDRLAAEGWKPILMSTATAGSGDIKIFIVLEKREVT